MVFSCPFLECAKVNKSKLINKFLRGEDGVGVYEFQQEVIDRLARIETKPNVTLKTVEEYSQTIADHSERFLRQDVVIH